MKKFYFLFLIVLLMNSTGLQAQWTNIGTFNSHASDLQVFDNKLFVCGNFTKVNNNNCYFSTFYNGTSFNLHTYMISGTGLSKTTIFNNELYGVGGMNHGTVIGVSKWNGTTWVDAGSTNKSHHQIYSTNNELYVSNFDGLVRKRTTTSTFSDFYDFGGSNKLRYIYGYNNNIVFAGNFTEVGGVAAKNIVMWDGSSWHAMGLGIEGMVYSMAVYNNELFIGGKISKAGGQNVKDIAKWDGTSWSSVGDGVTGVSLNGVRGMAVINNELWIVGDFEGVGNITTYDVAKWNGSQWSSVGFPNIEETVLNAVCSYNNKVYVSGGTMYTNFLYRLDGGTDMSESEPTNFLKVYPNPVQNELNVEIGASNIANIRIEVYDLFGKKYFERELSNVQNNFLTQIVISNYPKGTYLLIVRCSESNMIINRDKLIVQ